MLEATLTNIAYQWDFFLDFWKSSVGIIKKGQAYMNGIFRHTEMYFLSMLNEFRDLKVKTKKKSVDKFRTIDIIQLLL